MNNFDKQLIEIVQQEFPTDTQIVEVMKWLIGKGVLNTTIARRLAVRSYVDCLMVSGKYGKMDALYRAADHFECTYHTVRNYVYQEY